MQPKLTVQERLKDLRVVDFISISIRVEIHAFLRSFPTFWTYGRERLFSLNCTCKSPMHLEN